MDMTDFDNELGISRNGNKIFPSEESLLENISCSKECGVVEVKVTKTRNVRKSTRRFKRTLN
jgi:hypothetical protein